VRIASLSIKFLAAFLLLTLSTPAGANVPIGRPENADAVSPGDATQAPEQIHPDSEKVSIAPHRAIYKMTLASVKNGSNITDVSGQMMFEWSDACDGWAVQQRLQLHFSYAEGDETNVNSTVISWESKDGKHYNFNVRRVSNDKETEVYRGKATLAEDGTGTVIYTDPKSKEVKLSEGTIFPSTHTMLVIQKALAGEKLFTRRVFDGSDEDGSDDISVFVGPEASELQKAELSPDLRSNSLLNQPAWPIRMAFFKLDTETGEPDYEMNLLLQSNGIARTMRIDYGDFSVSGTLTNLEALPSSGC